MKTLTGFRVIALTLMVVLIFTGACKKETESVIPPTGELSGTNGCKSGANAGGTLGVVNASTSEDCLQYQYDGKSVLTLSHINAGFNCCPGEITATVQISGNTITITETESEQSCHCLCLFDVDYRIRNLTPGTYTVIINGLYLGDGPHLQFSINLNETANGNLCLNRDYYPWAQ